MTTTEDRDRLARLEAAYEFIRENMTTKEDAARLEGRMDAMNAELNGRMDSMGARLDGRMDSMNADLNGRMDVLNGRMDTMQTRFEGRMDAMESRLLIRFGAGGVMLAGVVIGVLKFWT